MFVILMHDRIAACVVAAHRNSRERKPTDCIAKHGAEIRRCGADKQAEARENSEAAKDVAGIPEHFALLKRRLRYVYPLINVFANAFTCALIRILMRSAVTNESPNLENGEELDLPKGLVFRKRRERETAQRIAVIRG